MRSLILLATLAVPASSIAQPPQPAPRTAPVATTPQASRVDCFAARVEHARPGEPARSRRLDEMPPGRLYHAVERSVDGCRELVLVSEERERIRR